MRLGRQGGWQTRRTSRSVSVGGPPRWHAALLASASCRRGRPWTRAPCGSARFGAVRCGVVRCGTARAAVARGPGRARMALQNLCALSTQSLPVVPRLCPAPTTPLPSAAAAGAVSVATAVALALPPPLRPYCRPLPALSGSPSRPMPTASTWTALASGATRSLAAPTGSIASSATLRISYSTRECRAPCQAGGFCAPRTGAAGGRPLRQ